MAFSGNFMCTSFKVELLQGKHDFTNGQDVYKLALYTNSASFTAATTDYTSGNEVGNSGSYTAGGGALTNVTPTSSGTTAFTDFSDLTFTSATITASGDKASTAGDFQIVFPTNDSTNAIIRIA